MASFFIHEEKLNKQGLLQPLLVGEELQNKPPGMAETELES